MELKEDKAKITHLIESITKQGEVNKEAAHEATLEWKMTILAFSIKQKSTVCLTFLLNM